MEAKIENSHEEVENNQEFIADLLQKIESWYELEDQRNNNAEWA